ncbi:MAG: diacylglycerol/lipid kinase family protein [Gemmatimonadaceae bacterium]
MDEPIFVIANPAAGNGHGERVLAGVARATATRRDVAIHVTRAAGDETRLAQRAIARGAPTLIAIGGDGTWSKVASAVLRSGQRIPLALIAAGMGNDFAKSVGAPASDIHRTLALIDSGETRRVDAGAIEDRFFLVCCGFGFDTAVLQRMRLVRGLRGSARYVYSAVRELPSYDGFDVSITGSDDERGPSDAARRLLMLVVANAQHYGGAFRIAPNASLSDGLLDGIALSQVGTLARAGLLLAAMRGAHVHSPSVREYQQPSFDLRFPAPPLYNLDGDLYQARSRTLRLECLAGALTVVAPAA